LIIVTLRLLYWRLVRSALMVKRSPLVLMVDCSYYSQSYHLAIMILLVTSSYYYLVL